jgi:predicted transcriptional regulator
MAQDSIPAVESMPPACGARLRSGGLCEARPACGKTRCRSHGGAPGSGAPKGNRNALKHGTHTAASRAHLKAIRDYVRASWILMDAVDAGVRSAALLRYHTAIESIADRLATTDRRLLGE